MSKVCMYEAKPRIYEPYEYYIHSSLEAKQSHNIKRANEASCDVHIFVCFKLRSINTSNSLQFYECVYSLSYMLHSDNMFVLYVDRERNINDRFSFLQMLNLCGDRNVENYCCFSYIIVL